MQQPSRLVVSPISVVPILERPGFNVLLQQFVNHRQVGNLGTGASRNSAIGQQMALIFNNKVLGRVASACVSPGALSQTLALHRIYRLNSRLT